MTRDLDSLARAIAAPYYDDALPAHDHFHAKRVRDLALRLADDLAAPVDREALAAAAWLHDIGRPRERTGRVDDHDAWAAARARDLLAEEGVAAERVAAVAACVRRHSIRASSPDPETPAAKLLFDADKLDAAGAVGLLRLACIAGERSGRSGEAYARLDLTTVPELDGDLPDATLLKEWTRERLDRLHTEPARRLGESRWQFVETFFERFERELGVDGTH